MKKPLIFFLIAGLCAVLNARSIMLKAGPYLGYYQPRDEVFQQIYGSGGSIYGARAGLTVWKMLSVWMNYSQYRAIGKTSFGGEDTTMSINPLTFSLRFTAPFSFFVLPYAAAGITFIDFKEESAAIGKVKGTGSGLTWDFGLEFRLSSRVFIDFNVRTSTIKVTPEGSQVTADLGGLQYGGSLIIAF